jgi:O-antigen ligase
MLETPPRPAAVVALGDPPPTPAPNPPSDVRRSRVLQGFALLAVTLTRVNALTTHQRIVQAIVLLLFVWVVLWCFPHRQRYANRVTLAMVSVYLALVDISLIRGAKAGAYEKLSTSLREAALYVFVLWFAYVLVATARTRLERDRRLVCLVLSPVVYAILNLLLHFAHVTSPQAGALASNPLTAATEVGTTDTTLGFLGIHTGRVLFPMADSVNYFGIICSVGMTGAAVLAMYRGGATRRWLVLAAIASAFCVLLGDSRGPLASGLAVILYFLFTQRQRAAAWVAGLLPVLPILLVAVLNLLVAIGASSTLSRGNGGNFATATGRTKIWSVAWHFLASAGPKDLVGWGANGQLSSGASNGWAYLFRGLLVDPATANTHDLVLQSIFDMGIIGLLALAAAAFMSARVFARDIEVDRASPARALLAMLIVLILSGITEASPTYLAPEALVMMLLLFGAAAGVLMDAPPRPMFRSD